MASGKRPSLSLSETTGLQSSPAALGRRVPPGTPKMGGARPKTRVNLFQKSVKRQIAKNTFGMWFSEAKTPPEDPNRPKDLLVPELSVAHAEIFGPSLMEPNEDNEETDKELMDWFARFDKVRSFCEAAYLDTYCLWLSL
eukprot:SAG31_NODE_15_length_37942_cov_32.078297_32_plen_140_part_00